MALFESLSTLLTTKVGAIAAGVVLSSASVGVAAASGNLPDQAADEADAAVQEQSADDAAEVSLDADSQGVENRSDTATEVLEAVEAGDPEAAGGEFGEAVADAARGEHGPDDLPAGRSDELPASADDRAASGSGNAAPAAESAGDQAPTSGEDEAEEHAATSGGNEAAAEAGEGLATADEQRGAERP